MSNDELWIHQESPTTWAVYPPTGKRFKRRHKHEFFLITATSEEAKNAALAKIAAIGLMPIDDKPKRPRLWAKLTKP